MNENLNIVGIKINMIDVCLRISFVDKVKKKQNNIL